MHPGSCVGAVSKFTPRRRHSCKLGQTHRCKQENTMWLKTREHNDTENKRTQWYRKQQNTALSQTAEHNTAQNSRTVLRSGGSSANCLLWPSISFCPTPYSLPLLIVPKAALVFKKFPLVLTFKVLLRLKDGPKHRRNSCLSSRHFPIKFPLHA